MIMIIVHVEQCCYSYGSVPHNENNSVPGGMEFSLNGIIYHPRDVYTNLTVKWFKSNAPPTLIGVSARPEMISDNHSDYNFSRHELNSTRNCIEGPLYRDTFSLRILNFTMDKNGYYWYQLFINGSSYQPSQYAWFYADYDLHTQTQGHFKLADEIQCANATYLVTSPPAMTTTLPINVTMGLTSKAAPKTTEIDSNPDYTNATYPITSSPLATTATIPINATMDPMSTAAPKMTAAGNIPVYDNATYPITSSLATIVTFTTDATMDLMSTVAVKVTETGSIPIYYIIGALTVFIILVVTLAIVMLAVFIHKRHREHRQKTGESFACQNIILIILWIFF